MNNTLYIVIPAYNEAENINLTIEEWYQIVLAHDNNGESRLVVVDDGSKDNTLSILKDISKLKPLMIVLSKKNGGHGSAVLFGYNYAIDNNAGFIFQTDSDGQTDPKEFERFWSVRDNHDAEFGNRINREDGILRIYIEKVLCRILKHYFNVSIPDSNAPFRLMKATYLKKYMSKLPQDYNLPNVMFTVFGVYYGENVCFIPISFKNRQGGKNSINIEKIVAIGRKALKDFRKIKENM